MKKKLDNLYDPVKLRDTSLKKDFEGKIMENVQRIMSTPFFPKNDWDLVFNYYFPFPPTTGNHRLGRNKKNYYLKKEVKSYYNYITAITYPIRKKLGVLDGKLGAFIYWIFPDKRKRDVDNLTKVVFDSLEYAQVVKDDSLLNHRTAFIVDEKVDKENACAFVLIFKKRS